MANQISIQEKAKTLSELIDYYEICNKAEGKSQKTISWYSSNLRRFHRYLRSNHLPDSMDNINTKLLREYVLYLMRRKRFDNHPYIAPKNEPLSTATIHGHVRTLRAFFGWLLREELIEVNLASGLRPPRITKKVISTLSDDEIRAIVNSLNPRDPIDARNLAIFMLLLDTGLRISEVTGLKIEDVHTNPGLLKVMGKGKKERIVPIGSNAQRVLQRYLFRYRPNPAHLAIDNVFLSTYGRPLTENSIKLMFARLSQRSGVLRLHAHLCRHTFATRFLINGGDVFTLQQILGHSTLEMVRHYVNLASNHIAIQHSRFSPVDRLNLHRS